MNKLRRFILRMTLFLLTVFLLIGILSKSLIPFFYTNPALNALIVFVLFIGIMHSYRQVITLGVEIRWLDLVKNNRLRRSSDSPKLLSSIARILGDSPNIDGLSALSSRTMLDSVNLRLDESRDISRYLIGLLVFLGLLGTFWGLLVTISSVGDVIKSMNIIEGDTLNTLSNLKNGLEKPLSGMGTAFSSSLFGLSGSLILGFLDLQSGQAQNQFSNDLEEWFSSFTRVTPSPSIEGLQTDNIPAYVQALLQQTAEATNKLHLTLEKGEKDRKTLSSAMVNLAEQMSKIADSIKTNSVRREGIEEPTLEHIRSIDNTLNKLAGDAIDGRDTMTSELKNEIKILAKTISLVQSKNIDES